MYTAVNVGLKRKHERDIIEKDTVFGGDEFTMPAVANKVDLDPIRKPRSFLQSNNSTRPSTSLHSSFESLSSAELADFVQLQTKSQGDQSKMEKEEKE